MRVNLRRWVSFPAANKHEWGPDTVTIIDTPNLYNGIATAGGADILDLDNVRGAFIDMGEGNNTLTVNDGNFYGQISAGSGEDSVTLTNTNAGGGISLGDGDDVLSATGTGNQRIGGLNTGEGDDEVTLDGMTVNNDFDTGDGDDTVSLTNSRVNTKLDTGDGDDELTIDDSRINGAVDAGDGTDIITVTDSTLNGLLDAGDGDDIINVTDTTLNSGLDGGDGNDLISVEGGVINSGFDAGLGDDTISLGADTRINGVLDAGTGHDVLILPVGSVVTDATNGTFAIQPDVIYDISSGSVVLPSGNRITYDGFEYSADEIPCYTPGARILTPQGLKKVEDLRPGDEVVTLDNGPVPITWVGSKSLSGLELLFRRNLAPVIIPAGALGPNMPERRLIVSPQHRIFVDSPIAERMFGHRQVLVPAAKMVGYNGIHRALPAEGIEYIHFLCSTHQIVFAEGCATESLFLGPQALKSMGDEIEELFPHLCDRQAATMASPVPARPFAAKKAKVARMLCRHASNRKPLVPGQLLCS
ncbi:MAG: Hint domain-containing protein [Pseudomonadota bacterium]